MLDIIFDEIERPSQAEGCDVKIRKNGHLPQIWSHFQEILH